MTPSNPLSLPDSASKSGVNAPILWALMALAYLFEIGAIAVVINTSENLKMWAGILAMIFPLAAMVGVLIIRMRWEHLFYVSREQRAESFADYSSENSRKILESWKKGEEIAENINKGGKS